MEDKYRSGTEQTKKKEVFI